MRSAFLDDARPEAISHVVRELLERRGALISEHRHSRIRFHGLKPHPMSWMRAGYVGIYQALGESEAEVRLQLRARWPWRLLLLVASLNVLILLLTIVFNPPGTTWSILAILTGLALVAAGIVHVATLRSVRAEERDLMADLENAFRSLPEGEVESDEERELRRLEEEIEGDIARRRLAKLPETTRKRGFRLRPGAKATEPVDPDLEARREALLARKAELEARKREQER